MSTKYAKYAKYDALKSQVGGHPGILNSQDGSLIIKPCLAPELAFYQQIAADPTLQRLRPFAPKFFGTLQLQGQIKSTDGATEPISVVPVAAVEQEKESIVLENISVAFTKPAIIDIKLGTVLAEETASEEKRVRMEKTARETTSWETGVRLTGFQVYNHDTDAFDTADKKYGKSIKPADLPDGTARFFPVAAVAEDGKVTGQGLPAPLLLRVLDGLLLRLRVIESTLSSIELRMVGGSLLIVYESDVPALEKALETYVEPTGQDEYAEDDEGDDDGDDDGANEEDSKPIPKPFEIKVIDFAHTHVTPGQGPDQRMLKGLKTTISLLEGRRAQVAAL
ncbi:SAICAR synthase-like protein [Auriculariales sp. MPI-PUGE-AT-0066]|nr:SAICAR synthase-like protein [Auriculariales sp. MPI-PUGE-AT-0066]